MARMIPPVIDPQSSPPGEVEIFDLLKNEPGTEDWVVLHSLDIAQHQRAAEGEADFVVIVPGGAVICLEVKSHETVARDADGRWRLGDYKPELRGPFKQASEAMWSLQSRVVALANLRRTPFVSAVAFPRCAFTVDSAEWMPWQVIDERLLREVGIGEAILRVARGARERFAGAREMRWFKERDAEPTPAHVDEIVQCLRPRFEMARSPRERRLRVQAELRHFTKEQYAVLDALQRNSRLVIEGAAGTGKTFVAMEQARREQLRGETVLFACYNRLLGDWLEGEADGLGPGCWVGTFHALMVSIAGAAPKGTTLDQNYWSVELPRQAAAILRDGHERAGSFTSLIIDEAQDLCTPEYLDVMDLLLKNGLASGRFRMFGDFERQAIFTGNDGREALEGRAAVAYGELTMNCRNRPRVGHLVQSMAGAPVYVGFRRQDDGTHPAFSTFTTHQQQVDALVATVRDFVQVERYSLDDIVVLSPLESEAVIHSAALQLGYPIAPVGSTLTECLRYSTVHAYKGLDAPVVIVTDLDNLGEMERQLLYVAVSRATERISLLVHGDVILDFAAILGG